MEIQACSEFLPAITVLAVRENSPNRGGQPFGDLNSTTWDSRSGSWFREKPDAANVTHTFKECGSIKKSNSMRFCCQQLKLFFAILLACSAFIGETKANHPFHVSTAEVECNAKTKRLEVGLKCQTTDVERALRIMAGKKIDIENDPKIDELLTRYVTENFYLALAPSISKSDASKLISNDAPSSNELSNAAMTDVPDAPKESIKLVGKEFETKWIWVYFELQPPAGEEPLVLVNRVLFEVNTGQINTCLIRENGKRHALKSTANKPLQDFDRKWLTPSLSENSQ